MVYAHDLLVTFPIIDPHAWTDERCEEVHNFLGTYGFPVQSVFLGVEPYNKPATKAKYHGHMVIRAGVKRNFNKKILHSAIGCDSWPNIKPITQTPYRVLYYISKLHSGSVFCYGADLRSEIGLAHAAYCRLTLLCPYKPPSEAAKINED